MNWNPSQLEAFELNRLSWDERVDTHWKSAMYQKHIADLRAGRPCLRERIVAAVGDVAGLSLAHLQCHMGMETLSWSLLGADAVGLDFSQPAIARAEQLRDELKLDTRFVCCNVYDAVEALKQAYDIIFISVGAICWLPDIDRCARVVRALLKPGGRLYMNEVHPFLEAFDDDADGRNIAVCYPYLDAPGLQFDRQGSYADTSATFRHTRTVDYLHSLGSIVTAVARAGMVIDRLAESAECVWPRFKMMEQTGPDDWAMPGPALGRLPHTYTLTAHVPV